MVELKDNLELQMLVNNKEDGYNYKERREAPWRQNYTLYRDEVEINRLTQRQSVNVPLMKIALKTVLKDVDDMPVVMFENLDNDKEAQIFLNEYWKWTLELNNAEIQDIVDKKQDFFYGRTFDSWQVENGRIVFEIEDSEDILVSRYMNPHDIDSSRFLVHDHIFVPLSTLKRNKDYDQEAVKNIEEFFKTKQGIVKQKDNQNSLQEKNKKMSDLGVHDVDDPILGETYVELSVQYVKREDGEKYNGREVEEQIFVYVEAEEQTILMKKPQEMIIGETEDNYWRDHYRYNTWGDDVDKQDFWTDGIADIVRTPNIVLNSFYSQLIENRTLRNFGMQYYDSTLASEGFVPSTFNPVPWGWYPVPGKPSDVMQKVDIPDLSDSLDEMRYIEEMVEKGTGAVASKQGAVTPGTKTKFEINAILSEATERTQGMSKFYTRAWEQRAYKFYKLVEAAQDKLDAVKIYKKGRNTDNIFQREIAPKDWMTKSGYRVKVWSQSEKSQKDNEKLQKLQFAVSIMPNNPKLRQIQQRKVLEFADLSPDEITEVTEYEQQMSLQPQMGSGIVNGQSGAVQQPIQTNSLQPQTGVYQ